jgi:hypothetical protein
MFKAPYWRRVASVTAFLAALVTIVALAVGLLTDSLQPDEVEPATPLLIAAAVMVLLGPSGLSQLVARLRKVSLPALGSYEFVGTRDNDPTKAKGLVDLRLLIQAQLAYLAKHALPKQDDATYVTVGSLRYDRLIDDREAALLDRVMTLSEAEFNEMPNAGAFLTEGKKLSARLIYTVFFHHVRREVSRRCFTIEDEPVKGETFPDLRATKRGRSFRIQPVALAHYVPGTIERLAETHDGSAKRIVVVPSYASAPPSQRAGVIVTSMGALFGHLN